MHARKLAVAAALALAGLVFPAMPVPAAPPGETAADVLSRLLLDNERLAALSTYKDDQATLALKLVNLAAINASRRRAGLKPVQLDLLASRVANKHCADMVAHGFMGHWSSSGEKPYQRYAFAGGRDHVNENLYASRRSYGILLDTPADREKQMLKGHQAFMAERPPHAGHRQNVLRPYHTHVGIGLALKGLQFRYCQEFIDRYVDLDTLPERAAAGDTVQFQGKVLDPRYGPLALIVYYDRIPRPMADPSRQPGWYADYGEKTFTTISPWDMSFDPRTGIFRTQIRFRGARPGAYYCVLYVKADPDSIPYQGGMWHTDGAIPATGVVIRVQ